MEYLAFAGYWFYGATSGYERASYYCSWGLLAAAPITGVVGAVFAVYYRFRRQ